MLWALPLCPDSRLGFEISQLWRRDVVLHLVHHLHGPAMAVNMMGPPSYGKWENADFLGLYMALKIGIDPPAAPAMFILIGKMMITQSMEGGIVNENKALV